MSQGRYSQRGWAFQGFAFRTWGLAGPGTTTVTPGTQERITIEASSKFRAAIEITARNRVFLESTGKSRLEVEV